MCFAYADNVFLGHAILKASLCYCTKSLIFCPWRRRTFLYCFFFF